MAASPVASGTKAEFHFHAADLPADILRVVAFEGVEALSELYCVRVELCSDEPDIDLSALVGRPACLEIMAGEGRRRYLSGIVRRFERTGHGVRQAYYAAEIVPAVWLLTKRFQSRVFQPARCNDMTVPGLITRVLDDAGVPPHCRGPLILDAAYPAREFVAQYRESDWDFVSRLMEHEGIYYFFEHSSEGHRLVLADGPRAVRPLPERCEFPYRDPNGLVEGSEFVFRAAERQEIEHGAVRLDDFDFRGSDQSMWLRGERRGAEFTALFYNDYPGGFAEKDDGGRYAQVRLEEHACRRHVVQFAAAVRTLAPGCRFALVDHPCEALNREYLITRVQHRGRQPQSLLDEAPDQGSRYEALVDAIPADVPFRPLRRTPRPAIAGGQTAVVVGPDAEEIHTDEDGYGRVKVQFHWDRAGKYPENGSCWVRVSQGWAGGGYGMLFTPRIGQEVIVEFLEGDPDRPIITGRVYNHDHMPPYARDCKTRSTIKSSSSKGGEGSNELTFEDLKGEEKLFVHAQKDLHVRVRHDRVENVLNDLHLTVDKRKFEQVGEDRHLAVGGNLLEEIKGDVSTGVKGKESKKVDGTMSLTVGSDVVEVFQGNHKHDVSQTLAIKGMNIKLEAATQLELIVGTNKIQISPAGVWVCGKPVFLNSGEVPPVMPPTAMATTPEAPQAPIEAEDVQFGADKRYEGEECEFEQVTVAAAGGREPEEEPAPDELTWIEIEMIDEEGGPWVGEKYELKLPDGRVRSGSLDAKGFARVEGLRPGTCQIRFPNLDAEAWERI